jgi:hypothetical protein
MIKKLTYSVYNDEGTEHKDYIVKNPTWNEIENIIRKLDRFHNPLIILDLTDNEDENMMMITGGNELYHISVQVNSIFWVLFFENKSSEIKQVWESDQGFECEDFYLIEDLKDILKIAKYYFEFNKMHEDYNWIEND